VWTRFSRPHQSPPTTGLSIPTGRLIARYPACSNRAKTVRLNPTQQPSMQLCLFERRHDLFQLQLFEAMPVVSVPLRDMTELFVCFANTHCAAPGCGHSVPYLQS